MVPGPVMLDIEGLTLNQEDAELLSHPAVGGLIFFARNFSDRHQIQSLVEQIRAVRPDIILAVDQEGGRVQRFKEGFTRLPPLARLGERYQEQPEQALELSEQLGWLMASEILALDIDLSFAPVLDIDIGVSTVIGDRAFAGQPEVIAELGRAYIQGMHRAGMVATGKHFPGHGHVEADSHHAIPIDIRDIDQIREQDLQPFQNLINELDAIMPAHVIYESCDAQPAGFSDYWIQTVLRGELGFEGVIFSDDLVMEGASVAGSYPERAHAALNAGCDMVLVCNNREAIKEVIQAVAGVEPSPRLARLRHKSQLNNADLQAQSEWQAAVAIAEELA